jgi:hypothetical protein
MAILQNTQVTGSLIVSSSASNSIKIQGSGSVILSISGSGNAPLFSIEDTTSGNLIEIYSGSNLLFSVSSSGNAFIYSGILVGTSSYAITSSYSISGLKASGSNIITVGTTTPVNPSVGDLWVDTN